MHASTVLDSKVYVICGRDNEFDFLDSVEVLDIVELERSGVALNHWSIFYIRGLIPRQSPAVCSISTTHILVMGGNNDEDIADAPLIDTRVHMMDSLMRLDQAFYCTSNSPVMAEGCIYSLVLMEQKQAIIKYSLNLKQVKVVKKLD